MLKKVPKPPNRNDNFEDNIINVKLLCNLIIDMRSYTKRILLCVRNNMSIMLKEVMTLILLKAKNTDKGNFQLIYHSSKKNKKEEEKMLKKGKKSHRMAERRINCTQKNALTLTYLLVIIIFSMSYSKQPPCFSILWIL